MKHEKILVVEDEKPLVTAISAKLKNDGFTVFSAGSAEQALKIIEKNTPDIIWLDHYLFGKENGLDLVAKLKNSTKFKKIPIFVVSNTATKDKVSSYLELGVEKYFTKSDNRLEDIISAIKNISSE